MHRSHDDVTGVLHVGLTEKKIRIIIIIIVVIVRNQTARRRGYRLRDRYNMAQGRLQKRYGCAVRKMHEPEIIFHSNNVVA